MVAVGEEVAKSGRPAPLPACILAGGETTVTLGENAGRGGRCQEMVLAAAIELAGNTGTCFLAAGTDGTDGPDDAAGAVVDGNTIANGLKLGRDARDYLARHDAYSYFSDLDEHLKTGPTRTNVMDIYMILVGHPEHI
jgi:glycerate-2-kinase